MMESSKIEYLSNLSLKKIREKIKGIRAELSEEKRKTVTYSKNFTLSLSNYCINKCKYCFYHYKIPKGNNSRNTILLDINHIKNLTENAIAYNCKEALLMSGERPDSYDRVQSELNKIGKINFINYVKDICNILLNLKILPHINIGLLDYNELRMLKDHSASMGLMLESTSTKLFKKGGVHENSPGKLPEKRIEHIINAGRLKIPFTTGLLIGIGESFKDRIKDLILIEKIHRNYGHIQEVIIQNFTPKQGIEYQLEKKISIREMLKTVGIARIIFQNEIALQMPPNLIRGYEHLFIEIGINDFGGISPVTIDFINPECKWSNIENLIKICEEINYILDERLPIYPKYIENPIFLSKRINKIISSFS